MYNVLDYVSQTFFKGIIPHISREEGSQTRAAMLKNLCVKASILIDTSIDIHPKTSEHNSKQASKSLAQ